ncbi:hypothetical protein TNCV_1816351 [Trichonephila clavipes]|nr:hypothetical protein TNCV_1816351 [Trichonephila clavipes]
MSLRVYGDQALSMKWAYVSPVFEKAGKVFLTISVSDESIEKMRQLTGEQTSKGGLQSSNSLLIRPYLSAIILGKKGGVEWSMPPTLHWHTGNRPALAVTFKGDRCSQTTLPRLASGRIKCLSQGILKRYSRSVQSFKITILPPNT